MPNREYVIRCLKYLHDRETWKEGPLVWDDHAADRRRITADAIALLQEQEPHVMMLEEVKSNEVVFMEDYTNSEDGVEPIIRPAVIVEAKNGGLLILDSAYWDDGYVFNTEEDYGKTWRCWTARPTNEQRKVVKWE